MVNITTLNFKFFILSTDSDYLLNLCNKQVQYLTISPAQSTSAWGHFRKMLDSAPLALRVPLLQARSHSDNIIHSFIKKIFFHKILSLIKQIKPQICSFTCIFYKIITICFLVKIPEFEHTLFGSIYAKNISLCFYVLVFLYHLQYQFCEYRNIVVFRKYLYTRPPVF